MGVLGLFKAIFRTVFVNIFMHPPFVKEEALIPLEIPEMLCTTLKMRYIWMFLTASITGKHSIQYARNFFMASLT